MNLRTLIILLVGVGLGAAAGISGYIWFVGGEGTPSESISAPTLDVNAMPTIDSAVAAEAMTQVAELNQTNSELQATIEALEMAQAEMPSEPTAEPTEIPASEAPAAEENAGERALYRIQQAGSQVKFHLQEDLRGRRTDVIGTTTEVAGDIIIDFGNPTASQIGTIRINSRTLATDSEFRNRALRSEILLSSRDAFEFIDFAPTAITGLPESIEIGQTYSFEITGNLTIIGVVNEVTFTAEATVVSESELTGTASVSVLYANWGITIPSVPSVANVTEDVELTINFTASRVEQ